MTPTPLLPLTAHLRLVGHAEGERHAADGTPSAAHATVDFEGLLEYESLRFEFGSYNFTDLLHEAAIRVPGEDRPAPVFGRVVRFGVTWDLWN